MSSGVSTASTWRVYGLTIESDFSFVAPVAPGEDEPDIVLSSGLRLGFEEQNRFRHVYSSAFRDAKGRALFELLIDGERELLSFTDRAEFLFDGRRILYRMVGKGTLADVEILFLSSVLAYWLEQRGVLVVHASAVEVEDQTIAFLAPAGGGKSTMAAAFFEAGHQVVSDDILPVRIRGSEVVVDSGYREIKLNSDTGEHLLGSRFSEFRLFDPRAAKRCLVVSEPATRRPVGLLSALYVLDRRETDGTRRTVRVESIRKRDAAIEIVRSTYTPTLVEGVGLAADRLVRIGDLVQRVPVCRLRYDSNFERLGEVIETIVLDLEKRASAKLPKE